MVVELLAALKAVEQRQRDGSFLEIDGLDSVVRSRRIVHHLHVQDDAAAQHRNQDHSASPTAATYALLLTLLTFRRSSNPSVSGFAAVGRMALSNYLLRSSRLQPRTLYDRGDQTIHQRRPSPRATAAGAPPQILSTIRSERQLMCSSTTI